MHMRHQSDGPSYCALFVLAIRQLEKIYRFFQLRDTPKGSDTDLNYPNLIILQNCIVEKAQL